MEAKCDIEKLEHHEQQELCRTRAPYRQGRKLTAVKVYTINDESQHLIISGVPRLHLRDDVKRILSPYGILKKVESVPGYPSEEFTEAFHIRYERIQSARIAKRFVDGKNFFGGLLHVFYAPELESVDECRKKLEQRRKDVAVRIKRHREDPINLDDDKYEFREQYHRKIKHPALPLTMERLAKQYPNESSTSIYDGIPREIDPRPITEPSLPIGVESTMLNILRSPPNVSNVTGPNVTNSSSKIRNYRGRPINEAVKVNVVRPRIIDTRKLTSFHRDRDSADKPLPIVKKIDSGITIKLLQRGGNREDKKKRIVIKDPTTSCLVRPSDHLRESIRAAKSNIREAMRNA